VTYERGRADVCFAEVARRHDTILSDVFRSVGRKRDAKMATLIKNTHKTGKVTWKCKVRRNGHPTRTRTFDTKADAEAWARLSEVEIDRRDAPIDRSADHTTLADILIRYRDNVCPTHRGAIHEIGRINIFLRHPASRLVMSKVTPAVMAAWRDDRMKTVSAGSILREMTLIRCAIRCARNDWGLEIKECPLARISKPKNPPARDRRISPEEEQALYEGCKRSRNPYLRPSIEFAIHTAMRQGEIVGLLWKNVDLERRIAKIEMTKSGRSRVVPLSTRAVEILKGLPRDTDRVFEGFSTKSVKHAFVRLTARLKFENLHFHDLRHEAISRLVERGLNLMEVAAISGHATLNMLKRYTHLKAEDIALKLG
jgi:integrase